jgi:uroporphyrinogen-III decarboxylase
LLFGPTAILGLPGLEGSITALSKARQEILRWDSEMNLFDEEIKQLGFPAYTRVSAFTPFDIVSDRLRGMRGSMLDMYKRPEKLIKTCDKLLPILLRSAVAHAKATGIPRVYMPLHRGAEGFMSLKQFETFYWPTLKGMILGFIEAGLTPCPFFEGDYTSRLKYLLELPKAKVIGHFDNSDINKVKEVLGNHICIMGNVPPSLLQIGTKQEVKDYCKKLIDDIGKGGGFIMASRSAIDEAKPENVKAMIDFAKEYGVYR